MALRSLRLRPSLTFLKPALPCAHPFQVRFLAAETDPLEQDLAAQAQLAAKSKFLSPYHKVSFDDRKVRIPWRDGKTSALYVLFILLFNLLLSDRQTSDMSGR